MNMVNLLPGSVCEAFLASTCCATHCRFRKWAYAVQRRLCRITVSPNQAQRMFASGGETMERRKDKTSGEGQEFEYSGFLLER